MSEALTIELKIDPELDKLLPPLPDDEFKQLEENILRDGIEEPLRVWFQGWFCDCGEKAGFTDEEIHFAWAEAQERGKNDSWLEIENEFELCIDYNCDKCGYDGCTNEDAKPLLILVDGHNRYRIAQKHGLDFRMQQKDFSSIEEAKIWMIDNQKGRRNLSDFVKYELAQIKAGILREKATKNMSEGGKKRITEQLQGLSIIDKPCKSSVIEIPHDTRKEIAIDLNWSTGKIAMADVVNKRADEETKERLRRNEISINKAYTEIKKIEKEAKKLERTHINFINDTRVQPYDNRIFRKTLEYNDKRFDDHIINENSNPTLTTWSRFYHSDTMLEYSLREYAVYQTFPEDFSFVGSHDAVKAQIGNAVAPEMGAYITSALQGKTIGDLFAGCGGFSYGAHKNGLITKWAIEWEELPAMSYKLNFPDTKVCQANIKALNPADFEQVDIIIGGPPCKGFSLAGMRFKDDPRNELYKEFLRFVSILRPNEFIMENVPQILDISDQIIFDFEDIGYKIHTELIKGSDIGMKQNRKRVFFMGHIA